MAGSSSLSGRAISVILLNMSISRRNFIRQSGLALTFTVAGRTLLLTPREAYARSVPFSVLNQAEVDALESTCDHLLPGARENGVAHFVDSQLTLDPNDSLLFIKCFNLEPPYLAFYRSALAEISRVSQTVYGAGITELDQAGAATLIEALRDGNVPDWSGPPPPLVYHALRNDAVDVVYGTMEGFAHLGIPYLAHIEPPQDW